MNKKNRQNKAREYLWLAVALMCLITAVHATINKPFSEAWYYYLFILIALFMYMLRRNHRIHSEKE